jgi:hypothetical protein
LILLSIRLLHERRSQNAVYSLRHRRNSPYSTASWRRGLKAAHHRILRRVIAMLPFYLIANSVPDTSSKNAFVRLITNFCTTSCSTVLPTISCPAKRSRPPKGEMAQKSLAEFIETVLDPRDSGVRSTESQITHRISNAVPQMTEPLNEKRLALLCFAYLRLEDPSSYDYQ